MAFKGTGGAPRIVRNFFIKGTVDGVKKEISTGPTGLGGEFFLTILLREDGGISNQHITISGEVCTIDGKQVNRVVVKHSGAGSENQKDMVVAVFSNRPGGPQQPVAENKETSVLPIRDGFWSVS
jgi:hypothetical protein